MTPNFKDTVVALSTAPGSGAIAVLRLSGNNALAILAPFVFNKKRQHIGIDESAAGKNNFALICQAEQIIDEVLIHVFVAPKSYTGEHVVEIACHGSMYIQQRLLQLLLGAGARMAEPGEFTLRAFFNGKFDLSQAEAVADLIASDSEVSHKLAMQQMRGGYSQKIKQLREQLINFASLIELELDFSEEDVEFANRAQLTDLLSSVSNLIKQLLNSFAIGNVLKTGVPVAIVGKPNAGKSTLLNALLQEERAIVSDIPGTTRDTIEDEISIEGIRFRFIDTAGLRHSADTIEQIGIKRTYDAVKKAAVVLYLFDAAQTPAVDLAKDLQDLQPFTTDAKIICVANKSDVLLAEGLEISLPGDVRLLHVSALTGYNIDILKQHLAHLYAWENIGTGDTLVSNARHADALAKAAEHLDQVNQGIHEQLSGELLAQTIRAAIEQLGHITGEVSSNDLLTNIFSKFCIGK